MKFINSAAKAFDGLCDGIDAIASSAQLLTNKVNKEIKIQQATAELDIKADIFDRKVEVIKSITENINKLKTIKSKDSWAFAQAEKVLKGEAIDWSQSNQEEVTSIS